MILSIHRQEVSILRGTWCCARWIEFSFAPLAPSAREWRSDADFVHRVLPMAPVEVEAPPTARVVERMVGPSKDRRPGLRLAYRVAEPDGRVFTEDFGVDAEVVYRFAVMGERGFGMAKRRDGDGQLGLFGGAGSAGVGAYGQPADIPDLGPVIPAVPGIIPETVPEPFRTDGSPAINRGAASPPWEDPIPFARSGDAIDRADRLEAAIREALPWLDDLGGRKPMPLTARNILREALGETAQARSA